MLKGNLKLKIDTKKQKAQGEVSIGELLVKSGKEELLKINSSASKLNIDFSNKTTIALNDLNTEIDVKSEYVEVQIKDLSSI